MPAMPRTRVSRSLSPSLLPSTPYRYLPYHRANSSSSFAESTSSSSASVSETSSISSHDSCSCDRLKHLNLSERSVSPEQKPRLPSISSMFAPRYPHSGPRPSQAHHRRAISLSSVPSGYIVFPSPPRSRPTPPQHASIPSIRRAHSYPHSHQQQQQQQQVRTHRPSPIRIPSPPLTPILESPVPAPRSRSDSEKLLLVTPGVAAYLRQGGSVSVKGPDGKSWRIRAPARPPVSMVRMMGM